VPDPRNPRTCISIERKVLHYLCTNNTSIPQANDVKSKLANYIWHDQDNRVVFECLTRLSGASALTPSQLIEQLPAQATRIGFPDVNWQNYLQAAESDSPDICALVDQLLAEN
jgi:hypothetical protein